MLEKLYSISQTHLLSRPWRICFPCKASFLPLTRTSMFMTRLLLLYCTFVFDFPREVGALTCANLHTSDERLFH